MTDLKIRDKAEEYRKSKAYTGPGSIASYYGFIDGVEWVINKTNDDNFNKYLLKLGTLIKNYSYTIDKIIEHSDYFKNCYEQKLSPYKALEMFYYHLNKNEDEI